MTKTHQIELSKATIITYVNHLAAQFAAQQFRPGGEKPVAPMVIPPTATAAARFAATSITHPLSENCRLVITWEAEE